MTHVSLTRPVSAVLPSRSSPAPQHCVGPIQRMQEHAYGMLESRAFVHQYEKYGLSVAEFQDCFARIEDIAQRYARL